MTHPLLAQMPDSELISIANEYKKLSIEQDSPLRRTCQYMYGNSDIMSMLALGPQLTLALAERLQYYTRSHINNLV